MISSPTPKKLKLGDRQTTDIDQVGGTGVALAEGVTYQASRDGFVEVLSGNNGLPIGCVDNFTPATTVRQENWGDSSWPASFTMLVQKGEYWKVSDAYSALSICWIPLEV